MNGFSFITHSKSNVNFGKVLISFNTDKVQYKFKWNLSIFFMENYLTQVCCDLYDYNLMNGGNRNSSKILTRTFGKSESIENQTIGKLDS